MASIIPTVGRPTIDPNVDKLIELPAGQTTLIESSRTVFATALPRVYYAYGFGMAPNVSNFGTLYATFASVELLAAYNLGLVYNVGTIAAVATAGSAKAVSAESGFRGIDNRGLILATATGGAAFGTIDYGGSYTTIANSGTIAAQSDISANAVYRYNGGSIVNAAGGSILAEGKSATAITSLRGSRFPPGTAPVADIDNAGLIQAVSTDPTRASVAIYGAHLDVEAFVITNSGTIRGDYAIYFTSYFFSPPALAAERIVNLASGRIEGGIFTDLGDDVIVNSGTIVGFIDMGGGDDVVDTRGGSIAGPVDLNEGDDRFIGGAASDTVTGGRGRDTLSGGDGADLLLGGRGDDVLTGGAGRDALYGEQGNDVILLEGGDLAYGGDGDDRLVLGDLSFAFADGGRGTDTLVVPTLSRILDLSAALATGRLANIERLELASGEIVVRAGDVAALTGSGSAALRIAGASASRVDLVGGWTQGAAQTVDGIAYRSFVQGGATVLVAEGPQVAIVAGAPAGALGLDAIGAGQAPPEPGDATGVRLASSVTRSEGYTPVGALTIDADERWIAENGATAIGGDLSVVFNRGSVSSTGGATGARALGGGFLLIDNAGTLSASASNPSASVADNARYLATYGFDVAVRNLPGNVYGISSGNFVERLTNTGRIEARSGQTVAAGMLNFGMRDAYNAGTISASSDQFVSVGVYAANGGYLVNAGTIEASAPLGAYGIGVSTHVATIVNSGNIAARSTGATPSVGVNFYYQLGTSLLTNSGTISADVAVRTSYNVNGGALHLNNSGRIDGRIELNLFPGATTAIEDVVVNSGTINGTVALGGGRDIYSSIGGTQNGLVSGEGGNDVLIGGANAERFDGGAGDDLLVGGVGDILTGGSGRDIFAFTGAGGGSATITDFTSGADRIDLTALAPTNVAISGSSVTVTTAAGVFTIAAGGTVTMSDIVTRATVIDGTSEADVLFAGAAGGATVRGGDGNDVIVASAGNDIIDGGAGDDLIWGGAGDDIMTGGEGSDTFLLTGISEGNDRILGFNAIDFRSIDRFDLGGRAFTAMTLNGTDTVLTYAGGTVTIVGVFNQTLASWNALTAAVVPPSLAPIFLSGMTVRVVENTPASTILYRAETFEAQGDAVTYSLGGNDPSAFSIDANTGELRLKVAADYERKSDYAVTVTATDATGAFSYRFLSVVVEDVVKETTALPPQIVRASPADEATSASPLTDVTLTFAGVVTRGSGAITLSTAAGVVVESFAADSTRLTIAGNRLTIDPTRPLAAGTGYVLSIAPGALNVGGASFAGLSTYEFATRAIDAASRFQLLVGDGLATSVAGSGTVFGTRTGTQDVTVVDRPGQVTFDPSFNAGGDRIRLSGAAADYTVVRSGSTALFSDGDTAIAVPIGLAATDIVFADGVRSLSFLAAEGIARLGGQVLPDTATVVTAAAGTATAIGATTAGPGVLMILNTGVAAEVLGTATVLGSRTGSETVGVAPGATVTFDPSFNNGGDVIALPGDAATYTAQRSGSSIVFVSATERVTLPVGVTATTVRFDDAERSLVFDPAAQAFKLGGQTIGSTATAVTAPGTPTTLALVATQTAANGDFVFTQAGAASVDATITDFARGDRLALQGEASRYAFAGEGGNVTLSYFGADGTVRTTTLVGVADPARYVHDLASARAAVGFDFVV